LRLQELIQDGHRIALASATLIEEHPLNIYMIALPFSPVDTTLYRNFHDTTKFPRIAHGAETAWSPLLLELPDILGCQDLRFSPDGTKLLSGAVNQQYCVHDASSGATLLGAEQTQSNTKKNKRLRALIACSPDGLWVSSIRTKIITLYTSEHYLCVWDPLSGALIRELHIGDMEFIEALTISSDGTLFAFGNSGSIRVCRVTSGETVLSATMPEVEQSQICALMFLPDSTRIVCGQRNGRISSCLVSSGEEQVVYEQRNSRISWAYHLEQGSDILSMHYTSDGKHLFSVAKDWTLRSWDAKSGVSIRTSGLERQGLEVWSAAFSADGEQIVISSDNGLIGLWSSTSCCHIRTIAEGSHPSTLVWSPNGRVVASMSSESDAVCLWDATRSAHTRSISPNTLDAAFSSDGTRIVVAINKDIIVLDAISGTEVRQPLQGHTSDIYSVAFCPDGSCIVSGSDDATIRAWDVLEGTEIYAIIGGHNRRVVSVAFSADGQSIVSVSTDHTLRTWKASTGAALLGPLISPHGSGFMSAAFSPDGTRIASASDVGVIYVWDAASGAQILGPLESAYNTIPCVMIVPSGKRDYRTVMSVAFFPDSTIGFRARRNPLERWDGITGIKLESLSPSVEISCSALDRFVVDCTDMWIKDMTTGLALCRPPIVMSEVEGRWMASSQTSVAFGTSSQFYVVHFPPWMLSPGRR
jgi:WD40 repeat protein